MKYIVVVIAIMVAGGHALAQPTASPPIFKTVASTDPAKGTITFRELHFRTEIRAEFRERDINGVKVKEAVQVPVMVPVEVTTVIVANKSRIITPDGKQLPIDQVWKRVKADSVVVVSGTGEAPAQAYLRLLAADTVVIIPDLSLPKKN